MNVGIFIPAPEDAFCRPAQSVNSQRRRVGSERHGALLRRVKIGNGILEELEMAPQIVLLNISVPVPNVTGAGSARKERRKKSVVQNNALFVGVMLGRLANPVAQGNSRLCK